MSAGRLSISKLSQITLGILAGLLLIAVFNPAKADAAYEAGRLIDDGVLLDAGSMSAGQVQVFLNSKGGQIANRSFVLNCDAAGQKAKGIYLSLGAPCGQTISAANMIYYSAQVYGINPKVILATLQKEQSLITDPNPTDWAYAHAMGYSCPTSGSCDVSSNFFWQIDNGTWVLRYHFERARGNNTWWNTNSWASSGCSGDTKYRKPSAYPHQNVRFYDEGNRHYTTIYIHNAATSAFYCYTPHVYNNFPGCLPAWGVSYASYKPTVGSIGNCYSGSYNFVTVFETWFGSTHTNGGYEIVNKYNSLGGVNSWLGEAVSDIRATGNGGAYQVFEKGKIYWHKNTGAWTVKNGDINNRYASIKYENGYLGYPTSDEISIPGKGVYQRFQGGQMYWSSTTKAWDIRHGAMFNKFAELKYEGSYLGFPTSGEIKINGGVYQNFQGGRLYWRADMKTLAMDMPIVILEAYNALGNENSYLKLPNRSSVCGIKNNGCWMNFDGGKIYWQESSGAFDIHYGDMNTKYAELGYEGGILGYPTSREIQTGTTCGSKKDVKQEFQNGTLYWSACSSPRVRVELRLNQ